MSLNKYIRSHDQIYHVFHEGLFPFLIRLGARFILIIAALFLTWSLPLLPSVITIAGVILLSHMTIDYLSRVYMVTSYSLYKKEGIIARTVHFADASEITDVQILQTAMQRIIWKTGNLKINTEGSEGYEIVVKNVSNPFQKKQMMYAVWHEHKPAIHID